MTYRDGNGKKIKEGFYQTKGCSYGPEIYYISMTKKDCLIEGNSGHIKELKKKKAKKLFPFHGLISDLNWDSTVSFHRSRRQKRNASFMRSKLEKLASKK